MMERAVEDCLESSEVQAPSSRDEKYLIGPLASGDQRPAYWKWSGAQTHFSEFGWIKDHPELHHTHTLAFLCTDKHNTQF